MTQLKSRMRTPDNGSGPGAGRSERRAECTMFSPNGGPGVETRLSLVYNGGVRTGKITLNRFVELVSTAPAKMFGLFPRKGAITVGSDADVVLFDPEAEATISASTHHMRVDYNCFEGMRVRGLPEVVMQRGEVLVESGRFLGKPGQGRFLARGAFPS